MIMTMTHQQERTNDQSNLTKTLHRHCTRTVQSYLPGCANMHASLGPSKSTKQMASRSVQPILHSSQQSVVGHGQACPLP